MADSAPRSSSKLAAIAAFAELLGAAAIVGGLGATAAIGVTAFRSTDLLSHEQAGRFMARVFEGSLYVEAAAVGLIVLGALLGGAFKRAGVTALLAGALVAGHFMLGADMREIRLAHDGTLEGLAADDPDRVRFGRRHAEYEVVASSLLLLGLGTLGTRARAAKGG